MEYIFLGILGLFSVYYIAKKVYGGIQGTDSPCAGCSDTGCPFKDGKEYNFDEIIKED